MTKIDYARIIARIVLLIWIYFDTNSIPVTLAMFLLFSTNELHYINLKSIYYK